MIKEEKKRPAIRFEGFEDDWEQRKLSDLANFSKGMGYSKSDLKESGTPIILYGRLYTKYETVIKHVDTFAEVKENSVHSQGGEVIVPASGETAEDISVASVVEESGVLLGGDLNVIRPNEKIDSTFLAFSISNGEAHRDMARRAQGKSVVHLHNEDLAQINLRYPPFEEQKKISLYLCSINDLITLHQRKLDQVKTMKKYFLQNLFPAKGENVPKIRFKGFTSDWEMRKFGDIFNEVKSGLSRMLSNLDIGLPVIRANNICEGKLNLKSDIKYWHKNDPQGANTQNYLVRKDDILINFINSEAKMGTAAYVEETPHRDIIYTTNILRCRTSPNYNSRFVFFLTFSQAYRNYIKAITKPAVNQASFTTVDFKKYEVLVPSIKEQIVISDFLFYVDKRITLHQRKVDQLQTLKKFMLQNLFI
ncbi:restriction endonuclease subunit S [Megasphaera sp.]|uniref:restriction endonuclease subunit S n=1 Tax=Megasphaera sp. TaxID=2023260 RepID=UPI0027BA8375|nr:restriction endonuclease subunit S [Megasphaera sp.]